MCQHFFLIILEKNMKPNKYKAGEQNGELMIHYKSGRKIIKTIFSIEEMKKLNSQLLAIWNDNSKFEMNPDTGHFYAADEMIEIMGCDFDIFERLTCVAEGYKPLKLWKRSY